MKRKNIIISILVCAILLCFSFAFGCSSCSTEKERGLYVVADEYVIEVGSSQNVLATCNQGKTISYESYDSKVATVDANGKITGISKGVTFIKVSTSKNDGVQCKVTVNQSEYGLDIGYSNVNLVVGSRITFNAEFFKNGVQYEGNVSYSVSSPDKCGFERNGLSATFTATEVGSFVVEATSEKATANCNIKVVNIGAKRIDDPVLTVKHCDTVEWQALTGATSYAISVNSGAWIELSDMEYSVAPLSNNLKDAEKIVVRVKALAKDNYDYIDSYITPITIEHDYHIEEQGEISCTKAGVAVFTCNDCERTYTNNNYMRPHVWEHNTCTVCLQQRTDGLLYMYDEDHDCYFVSGVIDKSLDKVYVSGIYDDGTHGKKEVKYLGESCFQFNDAITHVFLPETVSIIYENAFRSSSIEYIYMPGVTDVKYYSWNDEPVDPKKLVEYESWAEEKKQQAQEEYGTIGDVTNYEGWTDEQKTKANDEYTLLQANRKTGQNMFLNALKLRTVIVGKNFKTSTQLFVHNISQHTPIMTLYVLEKGGSVAGSISPESGNPHMGGYSANLWNGKKIYYDQAGTCGTWHYDEDGYSIVETDLNHAFDENDICLKCGLINTHGIEYAWDESTNSYYVSGVLDGYTFIPNENGKVIVEILGNYNDRIHGKANVTALGYQAFYNKDDITHVILPDTVTTIHQECFRNMDGLEYIKMLGVSEIDNTVVGDCQFLNCIALKTVIIKDDLTLGTSIFPKSSAGANAVKLYAMSAGTINIGDNNGAINKNPIYKGSICGTWSYGSNGYDIIIPEHTYNDENYTGKCSICGAYDTQGVTYAYDAVAGSYYVSSGASATGVVRVLPKYTDGTTAELPVTYLATNSFKGNKNITYVILPESVTKIGKQAFWNASNLVSIEMPGVSEINTGSNTDGDCQFLHCNSLTTVIIKQSLALGSTVFPTGSKTVQVYALQSGGTIRKGDNNGGLKSEIILQDNSATPAGNTWHYAEDGYTVVYVPVA